MTISKAKGITSLCLAVVGIMGVGFALKDLGFDEFKAGFNEALVNEEYYGFGITTKDLTS